MSNTHLLDQRQHKTQTDCKECLTIKIDLVGLFTEDYLMLGFNYYTFYDSYQLTFRFCVPYTFQDLMKLTILAVLLLSSHLPETSYNKY